MIKRTEHSRLGISSTGDISRSWPDSPPQLSFRIVLNTGLLFPQCSVLKAISFCVKSACWESVYGMLTLPTQALYNVISDISQDRASLEVLPELVHLISHPQLCPLSECISLRLPPSARGHLEDNVRLAIELFSNRRYFTGKEKALALFLFELSFHFCYTSLGKRYRTQAFKFNPC